MKMESIQTVIKDNDHDVERTRNHGELRQKCRDVFKGKNILLCVVIGAVWVVLLVPTVIYTFPQDYTNDEWDGIRDDCNALSSGGSGETSDFKGNSSLVCSEGFFVSVEDITNGTTVEVCRPECGEWEEVPHSTAVALYITHLVTDVVYLLSGTAVLVLSVIQYKRMFVFPSVFIVYIIISVGLIEIISFIATIGRKSLFCSSQDLIKTSDNPTVFCTLSGVVFYYLFLVAILLFFFHISSVCWGVKFPFHYNNSKQRGHFKYVHIGMVLIALLLPLASVGIALGNGGFTIAFSTSVCMAKEGDVGFYTILIPYSIVMAGGISLTAVILQELVLKHTGRPSSHLKGRKHLTFSISLFITPEFKLLIIFIYNFVTIAFVLVGFTAIIVVGPEFEEDLDEYFDCEATGATPGKNCSKPQDRISTIVSYTIAQYLWRLFPLVNLIYVVNVKELKQKFSICKTQYATST